MADAFSQIGYAFNGIMDILAKRVDAWGISFLEIFMFCMVIVAINRFLLAPMFGRFGSGGSETEAGNKARSERWSRGNIYNYKKYGNKWGKRD